MVNTLPFVEYTKIAEGNQQVMEGKATLLVQQYELF